MASREQLQYVRVHLFMNFILNVILKLCPWNSNNFFQCDSWLCQGACFIKAHDFGVSSNNCFFALGSCNAFISEPGKRKGIVEVEIDGKRRWNKARDNVEKNDNIPSCFELNSICFCNSNVCTISNYSNRKCDCEKSQGWHVDTWLFYLSCQDPSNYPTFQAQKACVNDDGSWVFCHF